MATVKQRWKFTASMVADAPDEAGVYALWRGAELLYFASAPGSGDTIRSRLIAHLADRAALDARQPSHYSWEICLDPARREAELLEKYRALLARQDRAFESAPRPTQASASRSTQAR